MSGTRRLPVRRIRAGETRAAHDAVALEEPLELRVNGQPVSVTMRTPGYEVALALGLLLAEGVITTLSDVLEVDDLGPQRNGNVVDVRLRHPVDLTALTRHVYTSAACGICGKASLDAVLGSFPAVCSDLVVPAALLAALPGRMRAAQAGFERSGGLHAAALFDAHGALVALREDVGRHNALDKLIGWAMQQALLPLREHVVLVSGRASFELVHKAVAAGVPVLAAVSAPSSLAVDLAQRAGVTLVGFLRSDTMNVYAHPRRVAGA